MKSHRQQIRQQARIIGREQEIEHALACLHAGRNLMLEGPVGVGKSILAEALADALGKTLHRVDGDERYTEQKMTGWYDPALVLQQGYQPEHFIKGPLALAMEQAGILFINEVNRMPESVQNVLLPAMEERRVIAPQYGEINAQPGFLIIATQNPVEFVATSHLSEALIDRFEFVQLDYQTAEEEKAIVHANLFRNATPPPHEAATLQPLIEKAVELTRLTRKHPKIRRGASIRAAISMVEIALQIPDPNPIPQAARIALLHRIEVSENSGQSPQAILEELTQPEPTEEAARKKKA